MPRRKQDCPKRMKWEEEARASGLLVDGEEFESPGSSPRRNRRNSGSITSRDAQSPKTSPRNSPRASPRESLNSSPGQGISPRCSPPMMGPFPPTSLFRTFERETDILDFSVHRAAQGYRDEFVNMSKSPLRGSPPLGIHRTGDSPLDLSVPRKRAADALLEAAAAQGKMNPMDLAKLSPWGFPLPPHLASTLALRPDFATLKSDLNLWNGKFKPETSPSTKMPPFPLGHSGPTPSEASKALERMSELSKLGGDSGLGSGLGMGVPSDYFKSNNIGNSSSGRTNAWQSHWLSKGQDATKDVLKCVWCKASFNTLADLTTHMKEAKHCGVNLPPPIPPPSMGASLPPHMPSKLLNCKPPQSSPGTASSSSCNDLVSSIKETMPLPRKLVRGQDVWLGKGAEQTRQILKCMWCGQSFKSLAEMTRHMQQTQHYTNIISQEQIISWKSPDDKTSNQSHVNAVLTCKVCDQAFSSLKELSNHMVKYAHYKEHIMRSITESGSRRRQTREKRKKSLPVRKLLELERAQQEMRPNEYGRVKEGSPSRINCEKCGDKIDTPLFVEHIRTCVGVMNRDLLKSSMLSPDPDHGSRYDSSKDTDSEGKMTPDKSTDIDPLRDNYRELQQREKRESKPDSEGEKIKSDEVKEAPSVLYALEKLIEKSFDSGKSKPGGSPLGSSILRRLGIDEGTDYSKPLMDPQLMGMYATFSRLHTGHGSSFNLPPSFGPGDRGFGMRGADTGHSPSGDSDTRDTFPRSPLRPSSRPDSRPASTGSVTRDGSASERSVEMIRNDLHMSMTDDIHPTENGTDHSDNEMDSGASRDAIGVKQEPNEMSESMNDREVNPIIHEEPKVKEELRIKDEFKLKKEVDRVEDDMGPLPYKSDSDRRSLTPVGRHVTSPTGSSRSGTPHSETSSNRGPAGGALGGLSALLGSVGGNTPPPPSSHPLAALQKLCDKTETHPRSSVTSSSMSPQTNPGAILAFSWACNDAVTADSIMKCAFCDTPFISKGAYRHHLSKMHFVKDGVIPEIGMSKQSYHSGKMPPSAPTPPAPVVDDSPHSKFLKYTELAKQLSSK